jgi:hypothetical protein
MEGDDDQQQGEAQAEDMVEERACRSPRPRIRTEGQHDDRADESAAGVSAASPNIEEKAVAVTEKAMRVRQSAPARVVSQARVCERILGSNQACRAPNDGLDATHNEC